MFKADSHIRRPGRIAFALYFSYVITTYEGVNAGLVLDAHPADRGFAKWRSAYGWPTRGHTPEAMGQYVPMEWAVDVSDLTKIYVPSPKWMSLLLRSAISSPVTALGGISFSVAPGKICAIVGPNGAGKSTLFRVLTGLTTPTSGEAYVHGIDCSSAPRSVRALIGFVPAGDQTLYLRLSCRDNLVFHGQLAGITGRALGERITEVLGIVDLSDEADRVGFALSSGMRARLQLARALLHRPRVLILDEPTAAIDPVGSYELLQVIEKVAAEDGIAVLLSSHRLEEIEALRSRVLLMDRGAIVYDGDLDALLSQTPRRRVNLRFAEAGQRSRAERHLRTVPGIEIVTTGDLEPTELAAFTDMAVGNVLSQLNGVLEGLVMVEEARTPLRDLIYGLLHASRDALQAEGHRP